MAGRPLGSLSAIGKQTQEERKIKKRTYKRTAEALERAVVAKRLKRTEAKQIRAEELLEQRKEELRILDREGIPADGNGTGLMSILK